MFNEMRQEAQPRLAQQGALSNWKSTNPELSKRCGSNMERLNTILQAYLVCMLDHVEEIEDLDNEFQIREFLDKYGQGFLQLNGIVQTVGQLST